MGVITTADEKRDLAKEKLDQAYDYIKDATDLLEEAMHRDTWGSGDYSSDYKEKVDDSIDVLTSIRRKLSKAKNKI